MVRDVGGRLPFLTEARMYTRYVVWSAGVVIFFFLNSPPSPHKNFLQLTLSEISHGKISVLENLQVFMYF